MSASSSTTSAMRGMPASAQGFRVRLAVDEGPEEVRLRDDAEQALAVEHGQTSDLVLEHDLRRLPGVSVRPHRDHGAGHDLVHREAGEEVVDLPHRQAGGLRGQVETEVAVRHDPDEPRAVGDQEMPDPLAQHRLPRLEYRRVGGDRHETARHELAYLAHHRLLSA